MLKDVSSSLPSADDVVRMLGLQARRERHDLMPSVALFGAGILVGAGLALLFAPSSGRELRAEISHKAADLGDRMTSAVEVAEANRPNGG